MRINLVRLLRRAGTITPPQRKAAIDHREEREGSLSRAREEPLGAADLEPIAAPVEIDLGAVPGPAPNAGSLHEPADVRSPNPTDASAVVRLANVMLVDAFKRGASHVHVEPYERDYRIRFRIDGVLRNVMALPMKLRDPLTSRIKQMAQLDTAARRVPQDGRLRLRMKLGERSRCVDFHVSVRPTLWGETITLRLVDLGKPVFEASRLGFESSSLHRFQQALARREGLIVVTGPRSSGRTTTVAAAVASLNRSDREVLALPGALESSCPGVNQLDSTGAGPADALRACLETDADVIVTGELRDAEQAELAVRLAEQGRLVLAIVTGGRAARVPERLSSWGIAPFRVADALKAVVAQRLVSRVCPKCKSDASANVPSEALIEAGFQRDEIGCLPIMKGKGCSNCNGTGCKSWVGIYEVMEVSEDIRELITTGASGIEIERKALEDGMLGLRTSGLEKIRCGVATIEEVQRQAPLFSAAIQADAGAELSVLSPGPPERVVAVAAERVRQQSAKLDQLESELQRANAEIDSLRERLFAEEHPHVASVRLADAHSEIETLRQCLFELNAFRIACEQWADGQARPRWRVARETVAAVEKRLERDL